MTFGFTWLAWNSSGESQKACLSARGRDLIQTFLLWTRTRRYAASSPVEKKQQKKAQHVAIHFVSSCIIHQHNLAPQSSG